MGERFGTARRAGTIPAREAPPITGRSLIAGDVDSPPPLTADGALAPAGVRFHAVDPAQGTELLTQFVSATAADVDRACWQAWQAFYAMQGRDGRERGELLDQVARYLSGRMDQVLATVTDETGLGPARVVSECERAVTTLRMFAELARGNEWLEPSIDLGHASRRPVPKPDLRKMLRPLGPVAVFGTAAYPLAFGAAGSDTASALAAGCPVIFKGHPGHPGSGELVARCLADAVRDLSFHPGTFSFLHAGGGAEHAVGELLVKHTCVRAVGFTGSRAGGLALCRLAAERTDPIPVFAQMGSTNPVFLLPEAVESQPEHIAQRLVSAAMAAHGQMCTTPGLVFVARSSGSETMLRELSRVYNEASPHVMLSHATRSAFARRVAEVAGLPGVDLRAGSPNAGHASALEVDTFRPGFTIRSSPVLFRTTFDVFARTPALHEEVFGPALIAVVCDHEDQLIEAATSIQGSLTGTIWAAAPDMPLASRIHAVLEQRVGRLVYNTTPVSLEVCNSMVHGGPYPVSSQPHATGLGTAAVRRWCRPVCYQNAPDSVLPPELRNSNPLKLERVVDGRATRERVSVRREPPGDDPQS